MARTLPQVIASVRAVVHNRGMSGSESVRPEDLTALCDAAQHYMDRDLMPMSEFIAAQTGKRPNDATRFTTLSDQD